MDASLLRVHASGTAEARAKVPSNSFDSGLLIRPTAHHRNHLTDDSAVFHQGSYRAVDPVLARRCGASEIVSSGSSVTRWENDM